MKVYEKGDIIFRQGDAGECMYEIADGGVGIYVDYGTDRQTLLTELAADEFFGEMGMIDHAPRSATAVALERGTQLREITEDTLGELFRERPDVVLMIMQQLSGRLRQLTRDYKEVCKTASRIKKIEEEPESVAAETVEDVKAKAERCAARAKAYR